MESDEYEMDQLRRGILRQQGVPITPLGFGTVSRETREAWNGMPVLIDPDGPSQDPTTGFPVWVLGATPLGFDDSGNAHGSGPGDGT